MDESFVASLPDSKHVIEEEDTCMSYEEEDTCLSFVVSLPDSNTSIHVDSPIKCVCTHISNTLCIQTQRRRIHACHMRKRIHVYTRVANVHPDQ